ncbi:MAG: hypothetical protein LH632_10180 [Rhodoferax sp.]|nr:hypothetical protein [Rhodoferax sp.]
MVQRRRDRPAGFLADPYYRLAGVEVNLPLVNRIPFALTYGESDSPRVIRSGQRLFAMLQAQGSAASVGCMAQAGRGQFQTYTAPRDPADPCYARLAALVAADSA